MRGEGLRMDLEKTPLEEVVKGYYLDEELKEYACRYCNRRFPKGEVFPMEERFYTAEKAVERHILLAHGGNFFMLNKWDSKYNTLTDHQKNLLELFAQGFGDKEIAEKLSLTPATIRRQKFTFREKAKQAKLYLALYQLAFERESSKEETMMPIHDEAVYYDDRYIITLKEADKIIKSAFESTQPLKLSNFPVKEKKKVVILTEIAKTFEKGKEYTEKEVNEKIEAIYFDYVTLRRYLIEYGFLDRKIDGSKYWII